MPAHREIELKLEILGAEGFRAMQHSHLLNRKTQEARTKELASVYFDTDKLTLRKNGLSLRIRRLDGRHVQTIKHIGSGNEAVLNRGEWESEIKGDLPDLHVAKRTALKPLLSKKLALALKPVFETRVQRTTYPIKRGDSEIEVSIDRGRIKARGRSSPVAEVELELKQGERSELFRLAREIADGASVELTIKTKAERGYELLTGETPAAVKSISISLSPDFTAQAAFKAIGRACLTQLLANIPALRARDAEGVHQARVSLRRLRSSISLFSEMLKDDQTNEIKRQLKWLTKELAPARELDVFLKSVAQQAAAPDLGNGGMLPFAHDLTRRRNDAFTRAKLTPDSARFRFLVLDVAAWIEAGNWTSTNETLIETSRNQSIVAFAENQLNFTWKKLLKRGKRLDRLNPGKRHKLRIGAKKLRYASSFFADVFPGKKAARRRRKFIGSLKQLQESLGDLNDIVVQEGLAAQLAQRRDKRGRRKGNDWTAFTAGRLSGREKVRVATLLSSARKTYDTFSKVTPYWI